MLAPTRLLLFAVTATAWLDVRSIQKWLGSLVTVGENSNGLGNPISQLHEDVGHYVPVTNIEVYPCKATPFATSSSVDKILHPSKRADVRAFSPIPTKVSSSGCLDYLSASMATLSSAVSKYTGDSTGVLQINSAEDAVQSQITKCINELKNSPPKTSGQYGTYLNTFTQKLIPIIRAVLNVFLSKKSQFTSSGTVSILRDNLSSLSSGSNRLASAVVAYAPAASKATASSASSTVTSLFSSAFAVLGARKRGELEVEAAHALQLCAFPSATSDSSLIIALSAGSTACAKYTGGLPGALPINSAMNAIQSQLQKATSEMRSSPVLTPAQADNAIGILKRAFPLLRNLLNCLVGKKGSLKSAGLGPTVNGQLTSLRSAMNAYCTAIIAKAPAARKSPAASASSVAVSIINSAISAFNAAEKRDPEPDTIPELLPRAYVDVTNDVSSLSTLLATGSSVCAKYTGGLPGAIPINSAINAIQSQISKLTTDVNNTPVATAAQAAFLIDFFRNKLIPTMKLLLNCLVNKKAQYKSAGLGPSVQGDLSSLSSGSNALATALIAKAPAASKAAASSISKTVISLFNSAISAFNAAKRDEEPMAAPALVPRAYADVTQGLSSLSAVLAKGSGACRTSGITPINSAMNDVESQISELITDINNTPASTAAQASFIITYFNNSIIPLFKAFLNCVVSRRGQFKASGFGPIFQGDLSSLSRGSDALATALIAKAPAASKAAASSVSKTIISIMNSAISAFNAAKRDPGPEAALQPRAYADVTNDLSALSTSVATLSSVVAKYTGGLAGAIPVNSAVNAVQSQISRATTDVNNTPVSTAAQAGTICSYLNSKLILILKASLNALVAKKAQFKAAGLGPTLQGDLSSLSSGANALAKALIAKAPSASKTCYSQASKSIISLVNSAISAFNAAKRDPGPEAAPNLLQPRGVTDDLSALGTSIATLGSAYAKYTGGLAGAIPINSAESAYQSQIVKLFTDFQNTPGFTNAQASVACGYVSNRLVPIWKTCINALVSKRAQFKSSGLASHVQDELSSMSSDAKALATTLVAKAPAPSKGLCSNASKSLVGLFTSTIMPTFPPADKRSESGFEQARDNAGVINDLSVLSTSISALSSACAKYTTGLIGLLPINSAQSAVQSQIAKLTNDIRSSPVPTEAQRNVICSYIVNKIIPIWKACLKCLASKKAVGQGDLSRMSSGANALATALEPVARVSKALCSSASKSLIGLFGSTMPTFPPANKRSESGFEQALAEPILVPHTNQLPIPTPAGIANDLSKLNGYLSTATKACNVYVDGPAGFTPILSADDAVRSQIVKINSNTVPSSSAQVDYTCDTLVKTSFPLLKAYIHCLVSKKNIFVSEGYQSVIGERIGDQDESFEKLLAGKIGGGDEDAPSTGRDCAKVASKSIGDLFGYAKEAFA